MPEAFQGVVVEIDVGDLDLGRVERVYINGKAMVLGGDLNPAGGQVHDRRLIPGGRTAALGLAAQASPEQLVPQADAENRALATTLRL